MKKNSKYRDFIMYLKGPALNTIVINDVLFTPESQGQVKASRAFYLREVTVSHSAMSQPMWTILLRKSSLESLLPAGIIKMLSATVQQEC